MGCLDSTTSPRAVPSRSRCFRTDGRAGRQGRPQPSRTGAGSSKAATAAVREHGITWPSLFDGEGFDSPHALRTNTEQVPHMYLVDRAGKVAALRLTFFGEEEVKHAQAAIKRCLGKQ